MLWDRWLLPQPTEAYLDDTVFSMRNKPTKENQSSIQKENQHGQPAFMMQRGTDSCHG